MESKICDKEFIINNGVDCDNLFCICEKYGDKELEIDAEGNERFFSGISYAIYKNGNLNFYCHYKDGFKNGEYIEFFEDGQVATRQIMKQGKIDGKCERWYPNGGIKRISEHKLGICLSYIEWNEDGNIIHEKKEPSESEKMLLKKFERMNNE